MKKLYVKQKMMSLSGKFSVTDEADNEVYFVEGSFMKIPKRFSMMNSAGQQVAEITKKPISFLPTFYVDVAGQETMTIQKEFSFFRANYRIDAAGVEVRGNWWDMDFEVYQNGSLIGAVNKKWFTFRDRYEIQIANEEMEALMVSLVISIDCVKAAQNAGAGGAAGG